jgi:hypothetical protein
VVVPTIVGFTEYRRKRDSKRLPMRTDDVREALRPGLDPDIVRIKPIHEFDEDTAVAVASIEVVPRKGDGQPSHETTRLRRDCLSGS